jgi:hypothetical protein
MTLVQNYAKLHLSDRNIFATESAQLDIMIPSRGLRWSGQTIGIGRRRIDAFSIKQVHVHLQGNSNNC